NGDTAQVLGGCSFAIVHFEDDLVLVIRLLDQVNVVLGVSGAQKSLQLRGRDAEETGTVTIDIDVDIGRVAKKIGARRRDKAIVGAKLGAERIRRGIDFLGVDAAQSIGVAAELAPSRADVDLQDWRWIQGRENSGNAAGRCP